MASELTLPSPIQVAVSPVKPAAARAVSGAKATEEVKSNNPNLAAKPAEVRQEATAQDGKELPLAQVSGKESTEESDKQALHEAVSAIQEQAKNLKRDLEFSVDEESGRTVITVIDSETDEIVRQIPPEEALHVLRAMEKGQGLFMDTKV